jgi:hypothetical protein
MDVTTDTTARLHNAQAVVAEGVNNDNDDDNNSQNNETKPKAREIRRIYPTNYLDLDTGRKRLRSDDSPLPDTPITSANEVDDVKMGSTTDTTETFPNKTYPKNNDDSTGTDTDTDTINRSNTTTTATVPTVAFMRRPSEDSRHFSTTSSALTTGANPPGSVNIATTSTDQDRTNNSNNSDNNNKGVRMRDVDGTNENVEPPAGRTCSTRNKLLLSDRFNRLPQQLSMTTSILNNESTESNHCLEDIPTPQTFGATNATLAVNVDPIHRTRFIWCTCIIPLVLYIICSTLFWKSDFFQVQGGSSLQHIST